MSLVISQTLPYTPNELHLSDAKRWRRLLPFIRPSITEEVGFSSDHSILVDTALARSKDVLLAAIGNVGSISSKILSKSHVAAFGVQTEVGSIPAVDIIKALKKRGLPTENGVVIIRVAPNQLSRVFDGGLEVGVVGELSLDHALSLLSAANAETRSSFHQTKSLLEHFIKVGKATSSTFREERIGSGPSVNHEAEVAEFDSAKRAIDKDLGRVLSSISSTEASVIYSVHFSDLNGLSRLENNLLAHEISQYLAKKNLPSYISQSTISDPKSMARGWAISLCPIPSSFLSAQTTPSNTLAAASSAPTTKAREVASKIRFPDSQVRRIVTAGCETVIRDEPAITEYDTIVGDGDCGYTLRDGAKQVLSFISGADLSALPSTLSALVDELEVNMGGTSGALYCIFLSSLAQELRTAPTLPGALKGALGHLLKYTTARLGDRTCLDCLIPFVETLEETGDAVAALGRAELGVETTKKLEAKLGRSSYLDEAATRGVPDPGAYGLLKLLEGMVGAK